MRRRIVVLVAAAALLACLAPSRAFDTWWFWGGEAHKGFITKGMAGLGLVEAATDAIADGANSQDVPIDSKFTAKPQNHCDDNKIAEAASYIEDRMQTAVQMAREAYKTPDLTTHGRAWATLYCFGEGLHTAHDFYCHSNYVELLLAGGKPLTPVDYAAIPPAVRSGLFYFERLYDNEATTIDPPPEYLVNDPERQGGGNLPEDIYVADLVRKRAKLTGYTQCGATAHSDAEFKERVWTPTYQGALRYVTDGKTVLHYELAKDNPTYLEARIIAPDGQTLFTKACALAQATSRTQWLSFEQRVRTDPDQQRFAAWNVAALKGLPMPELKVRELDVAKPLRAGAPLTGRLKIEVANVNHIASDPARPFKLKVHVGGTVAGTTQRGDYDIVGDGDGLADGAHEMPLELLKLKAPDEPGGSTLKLEVTFRDDPTSKALFPESELDVGRASATGARRRVWVLKGGKPILNPDNRPLTNKREDPDRGGTYTKTATAVTDRHMTYSDSGTEAGKTWSWVVEFDVVAPPPVVVPSPASFGLKLRAVMTKREWPRADWPAGAGLVLRGRCFDVSAPPGATNTEFADAEQIYVGRDPLPGGKRVETTVERVFTLKMHDYCLPERLAAPLPDPPRIEINDPMLLPWLRYEYELRELTEAEIAALAAGR